MMRTKAILGSAVFLVLAPGLIAGYVPWLFSRWRLSPPLLGVSACRAVGGLLVVAGLPVLLDSFRRFAVEGLGTPAPVMPTQHLVVTGWYRFVRNPMYVAVAALIFGQGLLFGNVRVLEYGLVVCAAFYVFVLGYEEPTLRRTFGPEYARFSANVPRWFPRLRPWHPE